MEALVFDLERGTKVIGSKKEILDRFGMPLMEPDSWNDFKRLLGQIYKTEVTKEEKSFHGIEYTDRRETMTARGDADPDVVVIDTISELSKKYQRILTHGDDIMEIQDWGKMKTVLDKFLEKITKIPCHLIANCHSKIKDTQRGVKILPYIDGSTKEDISKWFDFVFYTDTMVKKGKRHFVWRTERTNQFAHAKDRTQMLGSVIKQDYAPVFEAAKKKGWDSAKILVIGEPGSGKTLSLTTIPKED